MFDIHSLTDVFSASAAHGEGATYALAFLSSTALELIAVAFLVSAFARGALRQLTRPQRTGARARPIWARFDVLSLSKLLIPLSCLTMTIWIYLATQNV